MTDTPTKVSDIIVPEIFNPYFVEQTTRVNAFFASGVVATLPQLQVNPDGGQTITMPFWAHPNERAQLLDDNYDLEIRKLNTAEDSAVVHGRALVYGVTDQAVDLSGSDPMTQLGDIVAENWSQEFNLVLIATLQGAMGALEAESPSYNTLDVSGLSGAAAYFDGDSFIDATQLLGDMKSRLAAIAMHSAVEAHLSKTDLIEWVPQSEITGSVGVNANGQVPFYRGKRVIIDDALTPTNGVYDTYLFAEGAVGYAERPAKVPSETERSSLKNGGREWLVTRRRFVLHPRGIKWSPASGVPALQTPSDAELRNIGNWARAYDPKNIRIVRFRHTIA